MQKIVMEKMFGEIKIQKHGEQQLLYVYMCRVKRRMLFEIFADFRCQVQYQMFCSAHETGFSLLV